MFMKEGNVALESLQGTDSEAIAFTNAVNQGLTTEHLFTGSFPMRQIDAQAVWKKERDAGDIQFGIWVAIPPGLIPAFVGTTGLHSHRDIYKSWEFRILIFEPGSVGAGLGKIVTRLVTDYAFKRLNAHRVWLGVSEDNLRALKCYLDCGYRIEGRLVDELFYGGKYHSVIRMAVVGD